MATIQLDEQFDVEDCEFDWEAAVREIDSACQGSSASTSGRFIESNPVLSKREGPACRPRQTTLDYFVGARGKAIDAVHGSGHGFIVKRADSGDHRGDDRPCLVGIDLEAAKTWIYPVNVPLRDYQFSITKTALFSNTLVALPTGLGKTLIAAVVMYNFFRWFPEGKIVFTAPSRPLVMQQIEACHNTVGIPQEWAIDMTGQTNPQKRSEFWKLKRVFFVTPQVLEKDILSGICPVKQLTCLVIDEAHRAMGNYSYCVAVRELMTVPVQLRILALTATPGSKQKTIQNIIDNLRITTLEYRNESDNDVSPYVHRREIELIEVPMCKNSVAINNLLLEVIRPFATRLCSLGVLWYRDFASLNACELLNSRDKFRQAPPANLPLPKYGEVEAYFGVLITLCHIRKLLSSHGIRPSYDMLEEKLKQGSFSRLMTRNEAIWDAKRLMQQSLSHGAPNPKLEKMKEVLSDHFKTKDPKKTRAIIFSNFRGSVKDIMHSLSSEGEMIKATEFVGQSSGKSLKGQTQKVQQAVLQKFRSGEYNVIVATSIGEEGLDIMEVDLVICFDANISPLRMIQRMGRTGRKNDGRVVVLASEGAEVKGYLKKQANSKVVRKHMNNGGTKSFDFHPSPRMVPHACKPQVQFVELSIKQFVPRGKKVGNDLICRSPITMKISEEEKCLISRYFHSCEDTWKPSLIAFPGFQAVTSRVSRINHSYRTTTMLIDTMQRLQTLSSVDDIENHSNQVNIMPHMGKEISEHNDDFPREEATNPVAEVEDSFNLLPEKTNVLHNLLFGKEFVTVDVHCRVSITSVPVLSFVSGLPSIQEIVYQNNVSSSPRETIDSVSRSFHVDYLTSPQNSGTLASMSTHVPHDTELSPRLTLFIEKGVVPESPTPKNDSQQSPKVAMITPSKAHCSFQIVSPSPVNLLRHDEIHRIEGTSAESLCPKVHVEKTPVVSHTMNSSSEIWQIDSAENLKTPHPTPKFKRLRRHRDFIRKLPCKVLEEKFCLTARQFCQRWKKKPDETKSARGKNKGKVNPNHFIEEEAEVSSDARASEDEDEGSVESQYEDSFINDESDSAETRGRGENCGTDMMAIYRSLLMVDKDHDGVSWMVDAV
ncbi:DEAD/DEAH box RNA helicase family protein isoform X2 [Wolffia australiana]